MSETTPPELDRLWEELPTGAPPVEAIVVAGDRVRRRHRRALAGAVAAAVLVVGGGVAVGQGTGDPAPVAGPPSPATVPEPPTEPPGTRAVPGQEIRVEIVDGSQLDTSVPRGRGVWVDADGRVDYLSSEGYSSSCPPGVGVDATRVDAVVIRVNPRGRAGVCTMDSQPVGVRISGLPFPPATLTVVEGGESRQVVVEGHDLPVVGAEVELDVDVQVMPLAAVIEGAIWRGRSRTLSHGTTRGWSSSCPPTGDATVDRAGTVRLRLTEQSASGTAPCTDDAALAVARITGLAEAPKALVVVEGVGAPPRRVPISRSDPSAK